MKMVQVCENGDVLVRGNYHLFNNLWGADTDSGSRCLWEVPADGEPLPWATRWGWSGPDDTIKSYAAAVLGWYGSWKVADTGLPVQLSAVRSLQTSWTFKLMQDVRGKANVTYDMWLSSRPDHGGEGPEGEVMAWLAHDKGVRPIGTLQTDAVIAGATWDLWRGDHPERGWPVYSFVRRENTNAAALELTDFFRFLYAHGLSRSDYPLGVEAGAEVFVGTGGLTTTFYTVRSLHRRGREKALAPDRPAPLEVGGSGRPQALNLSRQPRVSANRVQSPGL